MPTLSSRRRPWPYDARITLAPPSAPDKVIGDFRTRTIGSLRGKTIGSLRGHVSQYGEFQGLMLLPQSDTSLMVAKKQTNLESLYPSTAEYDSAPVYRERTFMFRPTGGLGEPVQSAAADRRYHYGINVWVTGGLFGKGPLAHPVAPAEMPGTPLYADMCRKFIEVKDGTSETLFYLANQRVYRRAGDTNATTDQVVNRVRAGHYPTDAARFSAPGGAGDCLYVAWEDGVLEERTSAGVWAACSLPTGFKANFLQPVGDQLFAADGTASVVRNAGADPKVAGSWSGPIQIGTGAAPITALRATNNRLGIFKANGDVFTVATDGSDVDLFPGLLTSQDQDNGRAAVAWLDSLWFRAGRAFYQLQLADQPTISPRGPGRNLGNLSEVRGPVQCFAGWNTQMAFAVIYNQATNSSYLLSYGTWVPKADPSQQVPTTTSGTAYTFVDQYDGALKKWQGRKATAAFVSNIPTEARLYVGFSDGGYDWIKLVPYPLLNDQGGEYTLDESYLVLPLHHAMFQADNKHWTGVSIFGPEFAPGDSVQLSYQVKAQSSSTGSTYNDAFLPWSPPLVANGMRSNPAVPPVSGKALELKVGLSNTVTDWTPVLEGIGIHERLVPAFRRDYTLTVNANEYIARRDGASTRQSGVTIRKWMERAASAPASVALELPDETLNDVALFSYEEKFVPHTQRGGQGYAITVEATQFTVRAIYGIVARLRGTRIGDLRGYQVSALKFL